MPENHQRAQHTEGRAEEIPAARYGAFHDHKPDERGRDIYTTIGRVGSASEGCVNTGEEPGKSAQTERSWHQPERRLMQA